MSEPTPELLQKRLSASLLRIRREAPFFATLALFARVRFVEHLPTAATNGRDIFWNPQFLMSLKQSDVDGVMLHEVLHAALLHVPRRGTRDPLIWNVAADIVVNGMIATLPRVTLPEDALRDEMLEQFRVEEAYELLLKRKGSAGAALDCSDLLDLPEDATSADLEATWRRARALTAPIIEGIGGRRHQPTGPEGELIFLAPTAGGADLVNDEPPFEEAQPDLDAILTGRGDPIPFPLDQELRFRTIIDLSTQAEDATKAFYAFCWLAERTSLEWVQLFLGDVLRLLRPRGQMQAFASLASRDPRFNKLMLELVELQKH